MMRIWACDQQYVAPSADDRDGDLGTKAVINDIVQLASIAAVVFSQHLGGFRPQRDLRAMKRRVAMIAIAHLRTVAGEYRPIRFHAASFSAKTSGVDFITPSLIDHVVKPVPMPTIMSA